MIIYFYGRTHIFINNPYPAAINGSIWTIKHQFFMYILIVAINFAILKKHKEYYKYFFYILLVITMVSFTGKYDAFFKDLAKNFNNIGVLVEGNQLLKLICYFCAGVFINVYSDRIIIKKKYAAFGLLLLILCRKTILIRCLCLLVIPYVTIYLGTLKFNIKVNDISYQIYIWAFPIQQMIMYYLGGKINLYVYIALSVLMSCAVAYVTYYITEWPFIKIRKVFNDPILRYKWYNKLLWILPKKYTHKRMYKDHLGKELNLKNPVDFNEKLHYLILNIYGKKEGKLSDKIAVKECILSKNIKDLYVPKTLKVYKNVDKIKLDELPDKFVLKCNHSSGNVIICNNKDTFDLENAKCILKKVLKQNFAKVCYEYHYNYIKPFVYAEEYLDDSNHKNPLDYKIYCSNGKAKSILVCSERESGLKLSEYDLDWNRIDCIVDSFKSSYDIPKPNNLKKMINIAEQLSKDIPFVRVDLYEIDNKIYFGELTFTPAAGICTYYTEESLIEHGKYIDLNAYKKKDNDVYDKKR